MPRYAPNGITLTLLKDTVTGETLTRHPVDAREIVASDPQRYVLVSPDGTPLDSLEAASAVNPLITGQPHEFAQAIITSTVEAAAELVIELVDNPDLTLAVKRDSVARAIELEDGSKARKTLLDVLRDAQKQLGT